MALRLRALAATRWIDRSDEATREALLAGADEVERLAAELDFARRQREGDGDLIRRLYAEGGEYVDRLATAEALARGAQYREREALGDAAVLRARLDRALDERDEAENRVENLEIARTALAQDDAGDPGDPMERCPIGTYAATVLGYGAQPVGDLAGLGARAAGAVTRRQWRQCRRCGRCFWLTPDESVPEHCWVDPWGETRTCVATVTAKESE